MVAFSVRLALSDMFGLEAETGSGFYTVGFRLNTEKEYLFDKKRARDSRGVENIVEFSRAILNFLYEEEAHSHLHENDWNRTVFIDTLGVRTTDFDISEKQVKALIRSGREGVKRHFAWRNGPQGMDKP